jgi:hypothetical protein
MAITTPPSRTPGRPPSVPTRRKLAENYGLSTGCAPIPQAARGGTIELSNEELNP